MMIHGEYLSSAGRVRRMRAWLTSSEIKKFMFFKKNFLCAVLLLTSPHLAAMCPATTPWTTPVKLSSSGDVTCNVFSAGASAGFMVVWADSANNAHYSFSSDGITWQSGLVSAAQGNVASVSDVFVAGNDTGFMVTWIDSSNNGWSSFSTNHGTTWSSAIRINPNSLSLDFNSDVYVGGGSLGFVATMIGNDENAYVSFSTGTTAWSAPAQVTNDGTVDNLNVQSQTTRGFVSVAVVDDSCMLTWIVTSLGTNSAYFSSINPFSSTTVYPLAAIGFFESVPIVAARDGYFLSAARANEAPGVTVFGAATNPANWALFSLFSSPTNTDAGPWVAANQSGFMSVWTNSGLPIWTFTADNGFDLTPECSIVATPSTTIFAPLGLGANSQGFVATWLDTNDSNAYASFYRSPASHSTSANLFVGLLQQKYGPLL